MTSWKGKTRGGVAGYRIFILILRFGGLPAAYFILRFVAAYFLFFSPRSVSALYAFYRNSLQYGRLASVVRIYRNYYVFGQTLLDKVAILSGIDTGFTFEASDEVHLRAMTAEKRGGLLLGAHVGSWEIAAHRLDTSEAVFNMVLLDAEHQRIKELLAGVESQRRVNVIPLRDDQSHIFEIHRALTAGEYLCIHGDRIMPGARAVECTFFGQKRRFPYGVFLLGLQYNVPVSFVHAVKTGPRKYLFLATPPQVYAEEEGDGGRDAGVRKIADAYVRFLESVVRQYPDQWFNYYRDEPAAPR